MFNPWDGVGWIVLSMLVYGVVHFWMRRLVKVLLRIVEHLRYRLGQDLKLALPPQVGTVWDQFGIDVRVEEVYPDGNVRLSVGDQAVVDTPKQWEQRVRGCRLRLVRNERGRT